MQHVGTINQDGNEGNSRSRPILIPKPIIENPAITLSNNIIFADIPRRNVDVMKLSPVYQRAAAITVPGTDQIENVVVLVGLLTAAAANVRYGIIVIGLDRAKEKEVKKAAPKQAACEWAMEWIVCRE